MSKKDKPIDWAGIERDYRAGVMSNREIARWYGISETAIRKRAKAEGWTRAAKKGPFQEAKEQRRPSVEVMPPTNFKPETLPDRAKEIAGRLIDELDCVTTHAGELEELICNEEGDPRRRQALLKAISLPERAKTLKDIATTMKTLNEAAAPAGGKKEQQQQAAEQVAGRFGVRQPPRLVADNTK